MAIAKLTTRIGVLPGYYYTGTITTGATGDSLVIPPLPAGRNITCKVLCNSSSGYFQTTTSSDAAVAAGTATWKTWVLGTVSATTDDIIGSAVTGIRGVSVSGEITIEIVI